MKTVFYLVLLQIVCFACSGQIDYTTSYDLKYKFGDGSSVIYKFTNIPVDFDSIMTGKKEVDEDWNWAIKSGYERYVENNYLLINPEDSLFKIFSTIATDSLKFSEALNVYEFYIDEKGNNYSMYLGGEIDKLCGFIFQLPEDLVKVGDSWKTKVDDMSLNGYILMDSFLLKDKIILTKVESLKNELVATIHVDYHLYFKGNANGNLMETEINYKGDGLFSITRGLWLNNIGFYSGKKSDIPAITLKYELELLENIPDNLYFPKKNK
ncbi:MAG: hypothetical protein ACHQFW_07640 [Chitinophagales bacterium]